MVEVDSREDLNLPGFASVRPGAQTMQMVLITHIL